MRSRNIAQKIMMFLVSDTFDIIVFYGAIALLVMETIDIIEALAKGSNDGIWISVLFFAMAVINIALTEDAAFRYFPLNKIHLGRKKAGEHKYDRKEKESTMKNIVKIKMEMFGQKKKIGADALIAGIKDGYDIQVMMAGMISITETLALLTAINKSTIEVLADKIEEDDDVDGEFKQELLKQLDKFKVEYAEVFKRMAENYKSNKVTIEEKGRGELFEERPE